MATWPGEIPLDFAVARPIGVKLVKSLFLKGLRRKTNGFKRTQRPQQKKAETETVKPIKIWRSKKVFTPPGLGVQILTMRLGTRRRVPFGAVAKAWAEKPLDLAVAGATPEKKPRPGQQKLLEFGKVKKCSPMRGSGSKFLLCAWAASRRELFCATAQGLGGKPLEFAVPGSPPKIKAEAGAAKTIEIWQCKKCSVHPSGAVFWVAAQW